MATIGVLARDLRKGERFQVHGNPAGSTYEVIEPPTCSSKGHRADSKLPPVVRIVVQRDALEGPRTLALFSDTPVKVDIS